MQFVFVFDQGRIPVVEVRVREAVLADVPSVVGLSAVLFAEDAGSRDDTVDVGWPERQGAGYFKEMIEDQRSSCLVVEDRGEVAGYLVARIRGADALRRVSVAELESMCVRPERRGQRLGGMLVEEFLTRSAANGVSHFEVSAYAANERAIAFYRKFGFVPRSITLEKVGGLP